LANIPGSTDSDALTGLDGESAIVGGRGDDTLVGGNDSGVFILPRAASSTARIAATSQSESWIRWLLPSIILISVVPALIYQLTWQRALFSIYGINV